LRFSFVANEQSLSIYVNVEKKFVTTCKTSPSSKKTKNSPWEQRGKVKHYTKSDVDEEMSNYENPFDK